MSDNQGVKEETLIQTGRRGGDKKPGHRGLGGGEARWWLADQVVPHTCADKLGGTTREQDKPRNPRFQCAETKPQNL